MWLAAWMVAATGTANAAAASFALKTGRGPEHFGLLEAENLGARVAFFLHAYSQTVSEKGRVNASSGSKNGNAH